MDVHLIIDQASETPLFRQVFEGIVNQIVDRHLPYGTVLPSTREIAAQLGLSRDTINRAYEELIYQGYIQSQSTKGSVVCYKALSTEDPLTANHLPETEVRLSQYGKTITLSPEVEAADYGIFPELNYSCAGFDEFPIAKWQEILIRCVKATSTAGGGYYSDEFGHEGLRRAIATYLGRVRGLKVTFDQVVIFSGTQQAKDLTARLFIDAGDLVAMENPGFSGSRRAFTAMGAKLLLLPLDSQGLMVERLADAQAAPKLIYTTPYHQDPTGVVMSPARRTALLKWARLNNVLILEDDFDSAFRYGKKSIPPLACDGDGQVIYMYGFWKILFPVCRIGCIVVPPHLVPLYRRARSLTEREFDFVGHEALCQFLSEGHLDRHLRKVRGLYRSRRAAVALALTQQLGGQIEIADAEAGTNLLVKFAQQFNEEAVLESAVNAGLAVVTLSAYYSGMEPEIQQYLMPLGHAPEDQLAAKATVFAQMLMKKCEKIHVD